jgi:hypothetical protein
MAEVTIEARPNGPYIINGSIELRHERECLNNPDQDRALSLRCVDEKALLRRDAFENRLSSRGAGCARIYGEGLNQVLTAQST